MTWEITRNQPHLLPDWASIRIRILHSALIRFGAQTTATGWRVSWFTDARVAVSTLRCRCATESGFRTRNTG